VQDGTVETASHVPLTAELIRDRYTRLLARLRAMAERGGHDPDRLRIVAVTKAWPVDVCRMALEAGIGLIGESRVQEAEPKIAALPDAEWHLVGRLQSNKARRAARLFRAIHSIDSIDLLARLEAAAHDEERRPVALLEVNLSGEHTKAGFDSGWFEDQARRRGELVDRLAGAGAVPVIGLMTIARLGASADQARATFRRLRELRDALEQTAGVRLPELSMGMTADAEEAAEEGATLVRIGTALFGERPEPPEAP
jgi:pyridoxal phosphate enzyme (YggS family)